MNSKNLLEVVVAGHTNNYHPKNTAMHSTSKLTFEENDRLDLGGFCDRLEKFLMVEHDYVEGSLVVALNAGFGAGKTTFLEMWKNSLLARRKKGDFVPMPVILNAWESDHCGDPLLAILAGLIGVVDNWLGADPPDKVNLMETAKDVGWLAMGLANEFAAKWTGINAVKAAELTASKKASREKPIPDFVGLYQHRVRALKDVKTRLAEAFGGASPKVIIFVDELDRCRPDYAVTYLETIKHIFDVEGMVFVLAVDHPHLACSAKALFGNDLDFDEYFRKFCHRVFALPEPSESSQMALARDYVGKYLEVEGKRMSLLSPSQGLDQKIVDLTVALKLRPRQVQEAFRILGHTMYTMDETLKGRIIWGIGAGAILLSCLRVAMPTLFHQLKDGEGGPAALCAKLVELMGKKKAEWWVQLVLSGSLDDNNSYNIIDQTLSDLGHFGGGSVDSRQFLSGFSQAWGHSDNKLKQIAYMIEQAKSF